MARSSREMSQTVRIDLKHFLSRVRASVRPSIFLCEKHQKTRGNRVARASVYLNQRLATIDRQRLVEKGR